jgi:phenylacetate-coenzyme A ligase PaaK-like adenylate-forming protein
MTEEDLPAIEPMTKEDLMSAFDEIVTDPEVTLGAANAHLRGDNAGRYFLGRHQVVTSAGSSGKRGVFVYDWAGWRTIEAMNGRMAARDRLRHRELGIPRVAVVGAEHPWHLTRVAADTFQRPPLMRTTRLALGTPKEEMVARLNEIRPEMLAGYPSAIGELAALTLEGRLHIRPRRVMTSGEPLVDAARETMREAWGARVSNVWATSELGPAAVGCFEAEGMHLSEDTVIVEPVDEDGRPVPPGRPAAKTYVTNLFNHVQPLIRYELTDEIRLLEAPCPCGSSFRRIADIQGRLDEAFHYGDASVHPHLFRSPLARDPAIVEYQVVQLPRGVEVRLRLEGEPDWAALERELGRVLRRAGVDAPRVELRPVRSLERGAADKVQRFVPLEEAA